MKETPLRSRMISWRSQSLLNLRSPSMWDPLPHSRAGPSPLLQNFRDALYHVVHLVPESSRLPSRNLSSRQYHHLGLTSSECGERRERLVTQSGSLGLDSTEERSTSLSLVH